MHRALTELSGTALRLAVAPQLCTGLERTVLRAQHFPDHMATPLNYALGYLVNPPSASPALVKPRAEDGGNEMVTREYL